jgi:Tol biopolymer transport system component
MKQDRIVFTRFETDGREMFNNIYAINPDGTNETGLTKNPGPDGEYADHAAPRYNRDKTMIAYVSTRNNPNRLYNVFFLDLATGKTAQITTGSQDIRSVDWSPDDSKLVFSCRESSGLQQVHAVSMDGTGFTRLTQGPAENMNPLWSPRGDLITYVQFLPGTETSHIWVTDPQGGNSRQLTVDHAPHSNPSWSPDGAWIVFRCDVGTPHLRRINVDTGEVVLYEPPRQGADSSPVWSGSEIVFSSNCDWEDAESIFNLYKMHYTGGNIQRITKNQTYEYCGDW